MAAAAAACADMSEEHRVERTDQALESSNALLSNALLSNALLSNALLSNALLSNALLSNALLSNALLSNALLSNALLPDGQTEGEVARQVLRYIYSCAMPADATMELALGGELCTFSGGLGLAREWGVEGGSCDVTCQRWISACLLARTNQFGIAVPVSLRGPHPALTVGAAEAAEFTLREGAYYGNLFAGSPAMYACAGPASSMPELLHRFCSSVGDGCPIETVAQCVAPTCYAQSQACAGLDADGNAFGCHTSPISCTGTAPAGAARYDEVITVYLREPNAVCGNAICEIGEGQTSCPEDCLGWATRFGGGHHDEPTGGVVAAPKTGAAVVAGYTRNAADLGASSGAAGDANGYYGFVGRWGADAAQESLELISPDDAGKPGAVAISPTGEVFVAGIVSSPVCAGMMYVIKYDPAGARQWRYIRCSTVVAALAIDGAGDLYVAGESNGDVLVLKLRGKDGAQQWLKLFGGSGTDRALAVAVGPGDLVLVGGSFSGSAALGGKTKLTSAGGTDAFVSKFKPDGAFVWQKRWGGSGDDAITALVTLSTGDLVAAGTFRASVSFGGATFTAASVTGDNFLARFSSSGNHVWSKQLGAAGASRPRLAVDADQIFLAAQWFGVADFGGGAVDAGATAYVFVAKYAAGGGYRWMKRLGGPLGARVYGVARAATGDVLVAGAFQGTGLFGSHYLTDVGGYDHSATWDTYVVSFADPG